VPFTINIRFAAFNSDVLITVSVIHPSDPSRCVTNIHNRVKENNFSGEITAMNALMNALDGENNFRWFTGHWQQAP